MTRRRRFSTAPMISTNRTLIVSPTMAPHSLQVGPEGKVWITLSVGKGLASFDPATEQFQTFDHPDRVKYPHTLRFDDAGNVWTSTSNMPFYQVEGMRGKIVRLSFPQQGTGVAGG